MTTCPDDDMAAKVIAGKLSAQQQAKFDNMALRGAHEYIAELEAEIGRLRATNADEHPRQSPQGEVDSIHNQRPRAALLAESRGIDYETALELVCLRDVTRSFSERERAYQAVVDAARRAHSDFSVLVLRGDLTEEPRAYQTRDILGKALAVVDALEGKERK
jgi:hypothetical protein